MHTRHRLAALVSTGALAAAGLTATSAEAVSSVDTRALRKAVTVNGILSHERALDSIAAANGGTRASGTSGYQPSVQYVARKLRSAGYDVTLQRFKFPFYQELAPAELSQVTPDAVGYETTTFTYSGSGEVTGRLVPTNDVQIPPADVPSSTSGCEAADFVPAPSASAIALIQRGTCTFEQKALNAEAAGYAAAVIFNEGQEGRTDLLSGTLGNPVDIPVVGASFADGAALYRATRAGRVTARVFAATEFRPNAKTTNIIADSPAGAKKGETVVVGAHLDSVLEGPGINDNGSGSATILEIALQMARLGITDRLQRQVRFAFWGAEELGLLGSEHYVAGLNQAQKNRIYANLNFDMLGSPNYVRFVYDGDGSGGVAGPPGSGEIESIFTDYFADQGLASEPTDFNGRSDYGPFIAEGIPAGGLFSGAEGIKTEEQADVYGGTAGEAYDSCYHQACDDITNLNTQALFELGDAAAHATAVLALSRTGLYPDGSIAPDRTPSAATRPAPTYAGHAAIR